MKTFKILSLMALACAVFACTPSAVDPLKGIYPEKETHKFTSGNLKSAEQIDGLYHMVVEMSEGGNILALDLVCGTWFLTDGAYTAPGETLKKGNFSPETSFYNGKQMGKNGLIEVTKVDDNYTIKGNIWTADGKVLAIDWAGVLLFEKPAAIYNVGKITVTDPMVVYDMMGNPTVVEGVAEHVIVVSDKAGLLLGNFDLTTESGKPVSTGKYTIVSALNAPGQANNGWDASQWVPGMFGGCYISVEGENYIITSGEIELAYDENGALSIKGAGLTTVKVGGTDAGPSSFEITDIFLDYGYSCIVNAQPLMDYSTGTGVEVPGVTDNNIVIIAADAQIANVDVSTSDGSDPVGTFPVTTTFTAAGLANAGGNLFGMFDYGTWYKAGGVVNYVTTGNVVISEVDNGYFIYAGGVCLGICTLAVL